MQESEGGPVAEDVRRQILELLSSGTWAPGQRLGSERALAARFAVSRATLRSALLPLHRAGIVEKRPGRAGGTFIRYDVVERDVAELSSLPARLHQAGHSVRSRVLRTELHEATETQARALDVAAGTKLVSVRRLRFADDVPLSLDCAHFVADRVPGLLEQPLGGSLYELLRVRYSLRLAESEESIQVVNANPSEARLLEITVRSPLLALTRVGFDGEGVAFEYSEDLFRADRVRLVSRTGRRGERESVGRDGRVELRVSA